MRRILPALLLAAAAHPALAQSKAWQDTITLPTWQEGPPDIDPRLDLFDPGHSFYPYAGRTSFTTTREPQVWRRLNLENEYLICSFLPDLGGHLYSCTDKRNHHPLFSAPGYIRKASAGPRGAWASMGIEFSFPVAHSRVCVSPVDFGLTQQKDSAEVWIGDTDLVTGMRWLVEFVLRNGSAALEQRVTLSNPTPVRHPYLWWADAAIDLDSGTRFVFPAHVMATHGLTDLYSWPRDSKGSDLSLPFTQPEGYGLFAYGSREPFFAAYDASSHTATVHVASPAKVAGKKLYHWGTASYWPGKYLLEGNSLFVEIQAGVFPNQETYGYLQPGEQSQFIELWMPGRDLNSVSRATHDAILSLERIASAGRNELVTQLNVTHPIPGARLALYKGSVAVWQESSDLSPARSYQRAFPDPQPGAYRFELRDSSGKLLLSHTEGAYEAVTPASVKLGPQPPAGPGSRRDSPADFLEAAQAAEKLSLYAAAEAEYRAGLKKFANDPQLEKALGRLLVIQRRYAEAASCLSAAARRLLLDPELRYYSGLALAFSGKQDEARSDWLFASADARFGPPALLQLATLEARSGNRAAALDLAQKAVARRPSLIEARELEIALLRSQGETDAARQQLHEALALDPIDSFLRLERVRLENQDDGVWRHLAGSAERVLAAADTYLSFGLYSDALAVLAHDYETLPANQTEPGLAPPQSNALVAYYRAYCEGKLGRDPAPGFTLARSQSLAYVFPHRASAAAVLGAALAADPQDVSAIFLSGLLALDENRPADALERLQAAFAVRKDLPAIYYLLGRTLLLSPEKKSEALALLKQGAALNPSDNDLKGAIEAASAHPPAPSKGAPPPPSAVAPAGPPLKAAGSPAEIAQRALLLLAGGDLGAGDLFNAVNFPETKQPASVRQAYIEVQLQILRRDAARKDCAAALAGLDRIGGEDPSLPFTLEGFDEFIKGARFQYFLGAIESLCRYPKDAQRRWSKVARMTPDVTSPDFAFPAIAAQSLAKDAKLADLKPWLDKVNAALKSAKAGAKGALDYSRGILLLAGGDERAAIEAFSQGANSPGNDFARYLNEAALYEAGHAAPAR